MGKRGRSRRFKRLKLICESFFFFFLTLCLTIFLDEGEALRKVFLFYFVYIAATGYPSVGHKYNVLSFKAYSLNPKFHVLNMTPVII